MNTGFEVEWTTDVPTRDGESFFDEGKVHTRNFRTLAEAEKFAAEIFEQDFFGGVRITEFEKVPYEEGPGHYYEYLKPYIYDHEGLMEA